MTTKSLLDEMNKWEDKQNNIRECMICCKKFKLKQYGTRKFCSDECSAKGKKITDLKDRDKNKDKYRESSKKRYQEHKEEYLTYMVKYRNNNREKIRQQGRERVKCDICDKEMSKSALHRHKKNIHGN